MADYAYGHVTVWEENHFERFTFTTRQIQYVKAVIKKHASYSVKKLAGILIDKFGRCVLEPLRIQELRRSIING